MKNKFKANPALTDFLVLAVVGIVAFFYFSSIEAFEKLAEYVAMHEDWQLDEIIISIAVVGLCGFLYGLRRLIEARKALAEEKKAEAELRRLALSDVLTDLPNRRFLANYVTEFDGSLAASAKPEDHGKAVFCMDMTGFKRVNDLHGLHCGDELLQLVGSRLKTVFPGNLLVRLGGDEFLLIHDGSLLSDLDRIAHRMIDEVSRPFELNSRLIEVGARVGYASFPADGETLDNVVRNADIAMYQAKRHGGHVAVAFNSRMADDLDQKVLLESRLRSALEASEIVPYFQPLVNLQTRQAYGYEAFARWKTKDGEYVPPNEFTEVAEEAGLIVPLTELVLDQACEAAGRWSADTKLAFNLSPSQLSDRLIGQRVQKILARHGFPPERLEIEFRESAISDNTATAGAILRDLKDARVGIVLDDFGTGASSLSQIARFGIDRLKIDRSIVAGIHTSPENLALVRGLISMSRELGVPVTAEGVENEEQLALLEEAGCQFVQGFYFGRPVPADDLDVDTGQAGARNG